ncbi:metal ABC transporter ATP-binding protein [bacterium]|nr:metal ABC transporter ATP-binding protein [bacterium]
MNREREQRTAIHLEDVWVRYEQRVVLEAIHLDVARKEIVSIVGPNGSGKTTLLHTLLGLKSPFRGTIQIFGQNRLSRSFSVSMGFLPQQNAANNHFPVSVFDVVAFSIYGRKNLPVRLTAEERQRIERALLRVEMQDWMHAHYGSLSGGQKQRVLIARAMALQPEILILDEPATGLDTVSQDRFYALLRQLRDDDDLTILLVSHDIGAVSGVVDRIACLNRRIHFHGKPTDCIPSEALQKVFGENVQFVYHSHHCQTCEKTKC